MRQLGNRVLAALAMMALLTGLAACGGGSSPPPPSEGSATIGAAGGVVDGPDGVKLVVPAGALASDVTLRVARDGSGAPELGGVKGISAVYAVTPHGTAFAESARISIPFDPAAVAPGTLPVLMRAQPGGGWEALVTDIQGGAVSAADTPGLSFYAVGSCYTTRDVSVSGPDPLLNCPSANTLQLTLYDGSGAAVPVPRNSAGVALPAVTITAPTTLSYRMTWTRPAGTVRTDRLWMQVYDIGLQPAQQPLLDFPVNRDFAQTFSTTINPATVHGAGAAGGVVVRLKASAVYTTDAFYPGCVCFRPASWNFTAEIPVRVVYSGTQPVITAQPQNQSVSEGQRATFSVSATGANLSYQWSAQPGPAQNLQVVPGATASTFTTPPTTLSQNGLLHQVRVCSNANTSQQQCVDSALATLNVAAVVVAPVFTTQPASITVIEGQTASFTALASGQPAPTIGWSRVTNSGPFLVLSPICSSVTGSGNSTSATCTVGPLTLADDGMRVQAGASNGPNGVNTASSNIATVTVLAAPVAPSVTTPAEPADRTITAGGSVSWTVGAAGTAPLSYAWRTVTPSGGIVGGVVCEGGYSATPAGATVTMSNVPLACNGHRFFLLVSNGVNPAAESRRALLTVNAATAAPAITTPLSARSVVEGTQVTFSVSATGSPSTFTYGWTLDGAAVPNVVSGCTATSASCSFTAQLGSSGKAVAVSVANGIAPDATSSALLTVTSTDVAAAIVQQPVSQSVVAGATASFTISVAGTPTPAVAWETSADGVTWASSGSGTTLALANTTLAQNGLRVRAQVSNTTRLPGGGTQLNPVLSNQAMLTVVSNLPANALTAVQVLTVGERTLAVRADGSLYAWGSWVDPTTGGYTPNGSWAQRPVRVQGLPAVRQAAIGSTYASWVLGQDGTVWGWGFLNSLTAFAQGPNNTTTQFNAPVQVLTAANTPIDRVCQIEGTLYGVVMVRSDVVGGTCAASETRSVWYIDNISFNEANTTGYAVRFARLDSGGTLLPTGRWIREIVTSRIEGTNQISVFALANDGTVYAWGSLNANGQLGLGSTNNAPTTPQRAAGWQGAVRMTASGTATLALMPDGTLKGAGWNPSATLGTGQVSFDPVSTPTTLIGIAGASDVSTAGSSSMALVGGQLRYWGSSNIFATGTQVTPTPIAAPATPLSSISVGGFVAVAIGPGGAVYAWGHVNYRGCAVGSTGCTDNTMVPTLVLLP